ncbi:hypothetical protein GCM10017784_35560 [Deinococcus indicus]|uniref:hypothetical protein n=1 Tax=Deinococcus indicus TaxID=223556 RepID=UPI00174C9C3C|nr:hypothetical protein [Deinococcus indicus]GHG37899.1 hypothetical protein GCM10017784_35560 [Deinococcus indicus]
MLTITLTILTLLALAVIAAYASPTPVRTRSGRETQWDDPVPARYQRSGVDMDDVLRGLRADL